MLLPQVVVTDARVDVPRHSWSSDFYSMSLSQASVVYPATEAYMSQLKPDMSRLVKPACFLCNCRVNMNYNEHVDVKSKTGKQGI